MMQAWRTPPSDADHYGGITETWRAGPIYCSPITAQLVEHLTGVGRAWLRPVPLLQPTIIDGAVQFCPAMDMGVPPGQE